MHRGQPPEQTADSTPLPVTYSASGLPPGVSMDGGTGALNGVMRLVTTDSGEFRYVLVPLDPANSSVSEAGLPPGVSCG
jgi:hypothetical protein